MFTSNYSIIFDASTLSFVEKWLEFLVLQSWKWEKKLCIALFLDVDPRPPPIIHQGPQNQTLPVNSVAMLQCHSSGDPPPTIRWYKNGRLLSTRDPRVGLLDSGTLQISGKWESGLAWCKIPSMSIGNCISNFRKSGRHGIEMPKPGGLERIAWSMGTSISN